VVVSAPEDDVVAAAARNNAELCSMVSRTHRVDGGFARDAWTSSRRTPPLYPDAVTLVRDVDGDALVRRIDASAGASVKDSFATLDLAPHGFRVLFSAEWMVRPASHRDDRGSALRWSPVDGVPGLMEWAAAWRGPDDPVDLLRPELLSFPELVVLRGDVGGTIVAGVIANRSVDAVGVSNFFARPDGRAEAWAGALDAISTRFPGVDVVGYEAAEMLDAARQSGFRAIGPLRVWIKD
jgi:hypothetical protein